MTARDQAQPDAVAGAGQSRARAYGANGAGDDRRRRQPSARRSSRAARWRTTTSASRSGRRGYYDEALREYRLALDAGEDRAAVQQAMAEVHLLRREPAAAWSCMTGCCASTRQPEALERARRVPAPGGPVDEAEASYGRAVRARRRLRARAEQPRGGAPATAATPAIEAFRRALEAPAVVRRAAQPRAAAPAAAAAPRGARGVSARAGEQTASRSRGTASASC